VSGSIGQTYALIGSNFMGHPADCLTPTAYRLPLTAYR
jgi:hypothetical protein